MLNGLGICSGIGRLEHALDPWVNWVAHCEREPYPAAVLLGQTGVPTWDDLLTFPWKDFAGKIDIVAAGFPCQDVSTAGLGLGLDGQRSILVFEILKGCGKIEPQYIFLENVPRVTALMGERIITDLALLGYDARWLCLRSPDTSPIQEGERWFLLAQANSARLSGGGLSPKKLEERRNHPRGVNLQEEVQRRTGINKLSTSFVEILMGCPIGYTELKPWVMPWYQSKRDKRSKS